MNFKNTGNEFQKNTGNELMRAFMNAFIDVLGIKNGRKPRNFSARFARQVTGTTIETVKF